MLSQRGKEKLELKDHPEFGSNNTTGTRQLTKSRPSKLRPDNGKLRADSTCAQEYINRNWGLIYVAVFRTNDDTVRVFESKRTMHTLFSVSDKEKQSEKSCGKEHFKTIFKGSGQPNYNKTYFLTYCYWYLAMKSLGFIWDICLKRYLAPHYIMAVNQIKVCSVAHPEEMGTLFLERDCWIFSMSFFIAVSTTSKIPLASFVLSVEVET